MLLRDLYSPLSPTLLKLTAGCEVLCLSELPSARRKGLGIVLHYTRCLVLFAVIMPLPDMASSLAAKLVILAWSATEVCRYPFMLVKKGPPGLLLALKILRFSIPVITFPLGAAAEAVVAWTGRNQLPVGG